MLARVQAESRALPAGSLNESVVPAMQNPESRRNYLAEVNWFAMAIPLWLASPNVAIHQSGWLVRVRHLHCQEVTVDSHVMHWANVEVRQWPPVYSIAFQGWTIIEFEDYLTMLSICLEPVTSSYIRRIHHKILEPVRRYMKLGKGLQVLQEDLVCKSFYKPCKPTHK